MPSVGPYLSANINILYGNWSGGGYAGNSLTAPFVPLTQQQIDDSGVDSFDGVSQTRALAINAAQSQLVNALSSGDSGSVAVLNYLTAVRQADLNFVTQASGVVADSAWGEAVRQAGIAAITAETSWDGAVIQALQADPTGAYATSLNNLAQENALSDPQNAANLASCIAKLPANPTRKQICCFEKRLANVSPILSYVSDDSNFAFEAATAEPSSQPDIIDSIITTVIYTTGSAIGAIVSSLISNFESLIGNTYNDIVSIVNSAIQQVDDFFSNNPVSNFGWNASASINDGAGSLPIALSGDYQNSSFNLNATVSQVVGGGLSSIYTDTYNMEGDSTGVTWNLAGSANQINLPGAQLNFSNGQAVISDQIKPTFDDTITVQPDGSWNSSVQSQSGANLSFTNATGADGASNLSSFNFNNSNWTTTDQTSFDAFVQQASSSNDSTTATASQNTAQQTLSTDQSDIDSGASQSLPAGVQTLVDPLVTDAAQDTPSSAGMRPSRARWSRAASARRSSPAGRSRTSPSRAEGQRPFPPAERRSRRCSAAASKSYRAGASPSTQRLSEADPNNLSCQAASPARRSCRARPISASAQAERFRT